MVLDQTLTPERLEAVTGTPVHLVPAASPPVSASTGRRAHDREESPEATAKLIRGHLLKSGPRGMLGVVLPRKSHARVLECLPQGERERVKLADWWGGLDGLAGCELTLWWGLRLCPRIT